MNVGREVGDNCSTSYVLTYKRFKFHINMMIECNLGIYIVFQQPIPSKLLVFYSISSLYLDLLDQQLSQILGRQKFIVSSNSLSLFIKLENVDLPKTPKHN